MSLISYASSPLKALSVPTLESGKEIIADDFLRFRGGPAEAKTEFRLKRDHENLYLRVICFEPAEIRTQEKRNDWSLCENGDRLEIFFGAMEPVPWLIQFVAGAGGGRCDNMGFPDQWSVEVKTEEGLWKADFIFPIRLFRMDNLSIGFNICRYSEARKEAVTWCNLIQKFHEAENFGSLLMDDYSRILFAETGIYPEKELSRTEFETEINRCLIPAPEILSGPWISNPSETGMTVSFRSAGFCGAFLEYRPKQNSDWIRIPFDCQNGILFRNRKIHTIHLRELLPGTEYQYRIVTVHPLTGEQKTGTAYGFTTLDMEKTSFSFSAISDIHSSVERLHRQIGLERTKRGDFLVNIGDYLSCACGEESYFKGFLDAEAEWCRKNAKPLIFARGNHEQIGTFAGLYQDILPQPDGKTYYTFRHGGVFFLALDAGNDKPDDSSGFFHNSKMLEEERQWLKEIVRSEEYRSARWRIVLIHMPPRDAQYDAQAAESLISLMPEADLILSGHIHRYLTISPDDGICFYKKEGLRETVPVKPPCPVVANSTDTVIHLDISEHVIELEVTDQFGTPVDRMTLKPRNV